MTHCPDSIRIALLVVLAALFCPAAFAQVRLPAILSDNLVLQHGQPVTIWGWADPGERITVVIAGQSKTAVAGQDTAWRVTLDPLKAGGPYTMTVTGTNVLRVRHILAGEVWLGSGQSNMEQPIAGWDFNGNGVRAGAMKTAAQVIAGANYPSLRMFTGTKKASDRPLADVEGQWRICTPANAPDFSATGYFFSRHLVENLAMPVGFVHCSWGGSAIEPWIPAPAFEKDKALTRGYDYLVRTTSLTPWHESQRARGTFYNGMIAPVLPFTIRGILWYQGEANVVAAHAYGQAFRAMIREWRQAWGQELPFLYVQIAPHDYTRYMGHGWPIVDPANLRQGQLSALALPRTGMVVTTDIGDADDVHPDNKTEVGRRLAVLALGLVYRKNIVCSGPIFQSCHPEGPRLRVRFQHASGLKSGDGKPLNWFTLAGDDRAFVRADAAIDGDTVVVSSSSVPKPVAVRFAWADTPDPNLVNQAGLPASPFRTDDWPTPQEALDASTPTKK